jgi:hypothetical protein
LLADNGDRAVGLEKLGQRLAAAMEEDRLVI